MQTINIPAATREEYRLVFALARAAVVGDQMTQAAINKVALYQEALWARADQAQAQRQAEAEKPPPALVDAPPSG